MKSVCHSWPPSPEHVWEGFLLLPRGNLTALLGVDGSSIAVLGEVVASFPGKLAVFGGSCGLQKLKTEKSLALAFGALHSSLPTVYRFLATCLYSPEIPSGCVRNSVARGGGVFARHFSSAVHSSKY